MDFAIATVILGVVSAAAACFGAGMVYTWYTWHRETKRRWHR